MHLTSIEKAKSRLRSAKRAVSAMGATEDPNTIADNWVDFLTAWKGVYEQVKKASKTTPQEMQWFGGVSREKKTDPLLKYVFEARNDEEHGVGRSALPHDGLVKFPAKSYEVSIASMRFDPETREITLYGPDGKPVYDPVKLSGPGVTLDPITARDGRVIDPPESHLGESINPDVLSVATAALHYADKLVMVAEAMHTP
ncbi:hypothetical protein [Sphingorhabdus sp. M41]|uniref:hypothetical protein n=1 Tax=Sphingorhabdus sp. M41 TaxID=1806885 RepID=UPI00078C5739|nr:hypothetical protein [Sphingorhabdus sp. M41]AMO71098.1 hypothetical protein AZE99_03775 [Sphingorhabdus sp. M41]